MPHFMPRPVSRVRSGRGVMKGVISPAHRARPQGFSQRQLNVGKVDRRLDARGESRLLDDAQVCFWCYLVVSDTGRYTTGRYSTAPFAYWCCGARITSLFAFFHRGAFIIAACFVTTGQILGK